MSLLVRGAHYKLMHSGGKTLSELLASTHQTTHAHAARFVHVHHGPGDSELKLTRLKSCWLDLTGICFTKLGDSIRDPFISVPSRGQTRDLWLLVVDGWAHAMEP